MARRILEANLSHISPSQIADLHRHNVLHSGIGIMPYGTGFIFQAARSRAVHFLKYRALRDANQIWERAVEEGFSHLWLHENGPVHDAPKFDGAEVLRTFHQPPFHSFIDDSDKARRGIERLYEDSTFEATPMDFERKAEWDLRLLQRFPVADYFSVGFMTLLEDIHTLACGVEWAKLHGGNFWTRCDHAFAELGDFLLGIFETLADIDVHPLSVEEDVCAVRSRILRSLRMTSEWRARAA